MILSREFYAYPNLVTYINQSVQILLANNQSIANTKEYLLFYYILEDFNANFNYLRDVDIDWDFLGFAVINRNTRHAIESYLDLVNLSHDPEYFAVMEYNANRRRDYPQKFEKYHKEIGFDIPAKYSIAKKLYGKQVPSNFMSLSNRTNAHVHPNVFAKVLSVRDVQQKSEILKELLSTNLYIFTGAFQLILEKFNKGLFPFLNCQACWNVPGRQCEQCFIDEKMKFENLINCGLISHASLPMGYFHT